MPWLFETKQERPDFSLEVVSLSKLLVRPITHGDHAALDETVTYPWRAGVVVRNWTGDEIYESWMRDLNEGVFNEDLP